MAPIRPSVLVVEDDAIIAMDMAQMVEQCGCTICGPAGNVTRALGLIEHGLPDAGLLDINLGRDERSWPIARALAKKGVPVILTSGYGRSEIDTQFHDAPLLTKPVLFHDIRLALRSLGVLEMMR